MERESELSYLSVHFASVTKTEENDVTEYTVSYVQHLTHNVHNIMYIIWCLTSMETLRFIRDGEKGGMEVGEEGEYIMPLQTMYNGRFKP